MGKQEARTERIVLGTDRRTAQKIRNMLIKILSKDKKSDGVQFAYTYKPFRKKADYTIEGAAKTVAKCLKAFDKFVMKQEKTALKLEQQRVKAHPIARGKYYTMKSAKERREKQ